jgi:hypothetical protein
MHFSFHPKGQWSLLNEKATEVFGVNEARNQVRVYGNSTEAVLELSLGFFQQFPLKKKFFYFKNLDPHFDLAVTALSKMGLQARALEISDMAKPEVWQAELDREAGVFLYSYDNPVTGALHSTADLDRILKEKSIFRITLSHSSYLTVAAGANALAPVEIDRSEIQVRQMPKALAHGIALAYIGERGRFGAITAESSTPCSAQDLVQLKSQLEVTAKDATTWAELLKKHEQKLAKDFNLIFKGDQLHNLDRLAISFSDIDGHAFIDLLSQGEGEKLKAPGLETRFETASLSRWGGLKTMDWLRAHGLEHEQIRGLVVLLPPFFKKYSPDELSQKLISARDKILQMQNGEAQ